TSFSSLNLGGASKKVVDHLCGFRICFGETLSRFSCAASLLVITPQEKDTPFRQPSQSSELRYARTCYDHLAGTLGVAITNSLLDKGYLVKKDLYFSYNKIWSSIFGGIRY
ncbi:hypothetical protein ACT7CZ_17010, partial [Bacillus cereus]